MNLSNPFGLSVAPRMQFIDLDAFTQYTKDALGTIAMVGNLGDHSIDTLRKERIDEFVHVCWDLIPECHKIMTTIHPVMFPILCSWKDDYIDFLYANRKNPNNGIRLNASAAKVITESLKELEDGSWDWLFDYQRNIVKR
jgi:hypothetical protein